MNAKDFLKQLRKLDIMISNKLAEKDQWKAVALGITAQMGGERVQSSGSQQKMADAVNRYVDIEKEIDEYIDRLIDAKKDVINVIEQLDATQYDVLHKRYIQDMSFDEIGYACGGKTKSWATTTHGHALKNVQLILDERERNDIGNLDKGNCPAFKDGTE